MSFLERQLEDSVRFARIKRCFYICLVLVALLEILLPIVFGAGYPHFSFESLPAWGSFYGLVSCIAIILISKVIGKLWLMRDEDYYKNSMSTQRVPK